MVPVVSVRDLTYYYPRMEAPTLRDVNMTVERGEFFLICGPTGSGKTTLCRCLLGLIPHFFAGRMEGKVSILGMDTLDQPPSRLASRVGIVFQNPEDQLVAMSVEDEIAFGPQNLGLSRDEVKSRVDEAIALVGISELRGSSPYELSSGQQQKVAIASILAMHPEILILDEPTSMIDPKSAAEIIDFIGRLNRERGMTVVIAEHRLENVSQYADKILVTNEGRVLTNGLPQKVLGMEELLQIGVPVPKIIQLANLLRKRGVKLERLPLTVDEAVGLLEGMVG